MPRYLVSIFHADDYDPSGEDVQMGRNIDALNEDMVAAGVRVFVGGLHHAHSAKSFRSVGPEVEASDGSFLETSSHIGGLWVLETEDEESALEWGRRAALACRVPVEVRQFH